ncbi:ABC transporter related protein [Acidovorax delafieldii 2AN]|uniref:ABC transporter related protein n=1 Tax=Acidovorax delafieldii 2AN TaxID=573060 RepID=C5T0N9_ACIDE|nr:ABC transporter ATP-binding protein [Acidovorax delafieldii]EER61944.1 ABC transporter related protein [Acidovorax delafieldii 2AN]
MSSEIAVRVENLGKCFHIYEKPGDRLKQFLLPQVRRAFGIEAKQYFREFWALKNVSFDIQRGETVGIIGRNGSGKSTLLQLICDTLTPTTGEIETHGRVAALLELGSGFNPEFTGRENVYLNAAVLGLEKKEIDGRLADIIDFADIGQFIDQPVKTYSSGMVVRLAFAVQSQIDPDILIVDEALSVGDAKFQAKCFDRLRKLKDRGTSILLVTHSSEQIVTHCSKAVLLNDGAVLEIGEPRRIVNRYLDVLFGRERKSSSVSSNVPLPKPDRVVPVAYPLSHTDDVFATHPGYNPHEYRWGDGSARILDFFLSTNGEPYPSAIDTGQNLVLAVSVKFEINMVRPILGVTIKTKEGVTVYGVNSETLEVDAFKVLGQAGSVVIPELRFCCRLAPGDYFVSLGLASRIGADVVPHDRRYDAIHLKVSPDSRFHGLVDLEADLRVN